ncbi:uncharacterized protein MELLADRAFT_85443 [Melampsora larici-populina 98AG31]|uniref:Uncharacterized protein n=1 Tax=Melampsora larici-populina (strain 98AG31 / pathotype 3-4-7) TaxID=747676 RepID=F4RIQ3_MELLP|nr:uncharacterized protein MELLADRAFT_85443 [Melampsora larici-populina 98AG31]EGG07791.1 hypothetical protein MELLADRAFT_85443 [Melampsora larici-populina 98AG31]
MEAFKNVFGSLQKGISKARQWTSIRPRRGHRSQLQHTYRSDLEAAYYGVEFPFLHNMAESYEGLTPENASAPMTYEYNKPISTTTNQAVPIPDTILTIDVVSNLAEALSTDITTTINNQTDTHTFEPTKEPLDSLLNSADAIISDPISAVGNVMTPRSIFLKRRRMEVVDKNINGSSETKMTDNHIHKRPKIALDLSLSIGLDHSTPAGPHHNVHTLISFNTISPRHATETHLNSHNSEAPPTQILISIDHKTTRSKDISGLDHNSFSTPPAAITSDPILDTVHVKVFDQKCEVPVPPVHQSQTNESSDHPIILGPPHSTCFVEQSDGTPCTPTFVEQPNAPMTPAGTHQQIDSSDEAMILETPCTPVLAENHNGE